MRGKKIGTIKPKPKPKSSYKRITGECKEQNEQKLKIIDYLLEILEYIPGMKLPTSTYKKIEEYRETCGFDVLYRTLLAQTDAIKWALENKEFRDEKAKINYIFAILQNHVGDTLKTDRQRLNEQRKTEKIDTIPPDIDIHNDFPRKVVDFSKYVED